MFYLHTYFTLICVCVTVYLGESLLECGDMTAV